MEVKTPAGSLTRPCVKCRAQEATLDSRSQPVCKDCFTKFVATKCIKQMGILGKETRPPPSATGGPPIGTRRYLLGLSLGVSSTVLLHLLNENVEFQLSKGRSAPFELVVVHIEDDEASPSRAAVPSYTGTNSTSSSPALARYQSRYPRFTFHALPLATALPADLQQHHHLQPSSASDSTAPTTTTTIPPPPPTTTTRSAASRSDIRSHLVRRALHHQARARGCSALLLGHSTTALAELTLAEAAKGRGFAVPWFVGDGAWPVSGFGYPSGGGGGGEDGEKVNGGGVDSEDAGAGANGNASGKDLTTTTTAATAATAPDTPLLISHPLRDALRKELTTYATLTNPPLTELITSSPPSATNNHPATAAVVSHRDLSIEQVMARYFAEVEENYPSVVANVARTTGKLARWPGGDSAGEGEGEERCGLCGTPLDEAGDARWRGELGLGLGTTVGVGRNGVVGEREGRLCYGCERSVAG